MQRINVLSPTQALWTIFEMLLLPLAPLLKIFILFLQKWSYAIWEEKEVGGEMLVQTTGPERHGRVRLARGAFG